ncbi:hypothetical protein [Lentzea sp. NPDC092896]
MTEFGKHHQRDQPAHGGWQWSTLWPKVKVAVQVIAGQLIGWALRKWLG